MSDSDHSNRTPGQPPLDWVRGHWPTEVRARVLRERPWSAVWHLQAVGDPSPSGSRYLKAAGPAGRYEAPLLALLHRVSPRQVPVVHATDAPRGLLLLGDAGTLLEDTLVHDRSRSGAKPAEGPGEDTNQNGGGRDVEAWSHLLVDFAQLQRTAAVHVEDLLRAGVPDERPERLTAVLDDLLDNSQHLDDLTAREREGLRAQAGSWAADARTLAEVGIPPSVQHGDLHPGNVAQDADGVYRFLDFGDASVAHPFTTLGVPLQLARDLGAGEREITRMCDAYLEVFTDLAPASQLRRILPITLRAAELVRATAWDRALRTAGPDHPWDAPVPHHLRRTLGTDRLA